MANTGTMVTCKGCKANFASLVQMTQTDFANPNNQLTNNTYRCPNCNGSYAYNKSDHFYGQAGKQASII